LRLGARHYRPSASPRCDAPRRSPDEGRLGPVLRIQTFALELRPVRARRSVSAWRERMLLMGFFPPFAPLTRLDQRSASLVGRGGLVFSRIDQNFGRELPELVFADPVRQMKGAWTICSRRVRPGD
jgi:hypothetical protein